MRDDGNKAGAVRQACVLKMWYTAGDAEGVRAVLDELVTVGEAKDVVAALLAIGDAPLSQLPKLASEASMEEGNR